MCAMRKPTSVGVKNSPALCPEPSANFRSKYLDSGGVNPGNNNDLRLIKGSLNFDASASYKIDDNFTVTFQGINLSNEPVISYLDSVGQRLNHGSWYGREFYLGLRYAY